MRKIYRSCILDVGCMEWSIHRSILPNGTETKPQPSGFLFLISAFIHQPGISLQESTREQPWQKGFCFFSKPHVSQFQLKGTPRCAVSMLERWGLSQNAINPGPDRCQDTQREPHPSKDCGGSNTWWPTLFYSTVSWVIPQKIIPKNHLRLLL